MGNFYYALIIGFFLNYSYTHSLVDEQASNYKFTIGISLPLTGNLSEYGDAVQKGIQLAVEEHKEKFKNIRFIFEDDSYKVPLAIRNYQKLAKENKVNLFYNWGNDTSIAVSKLAEKDKFPALVACLDPVCSQGKTYVIKLLPDYSVLADSYLKQKLFRQAKIIKSEVSFFNGQVDHLTSTSPNQFEVISSVLPADTDLTPAALKIKNLTYDRIGIYLFSDQADMFLKTLENLALKPKIFGTTPLFNQKLIDQHKELLEGGYIAHFYIDPSFVKKYVHRYSTDVQVVYAGAAYENALLLADLFGNLDRQLSKEEIMQIFRDNLALKERNSVNGNYQLQHSDSQGWFLAIPSTLYVINSGEIKLLN